MKVVGIIAEYNPFHNGHAYHIQKARELSGADYVAVVLNGNFMERGEPALMDKYARTRMALMGGADLVFELPLAYGISSAEGFSFGSIQLLNNLGFVDCVCFGSESGALASFETFAKILVDEPATYRMELDRFLRQGDSFPSAREKALTAFDPSLPVDILSKPNNLLAIEYTKALLQLHSPMQPLTISRQGSGYNEVNLSSESFSSATGIRQNLQDETGAWTESVPSYCTELMQDYKKKNQFVFLDDFSHAIYYAIWQNQDHLTDFMDVSPELANRILSRLDTFTTVSEFARDIKCKSYTMTRIFRCLFHILLDLHKDSNCQTTSIRLLGAKKGASHLLRRAASPIINGIANSMKQLSESDRAVMERDIRAAHLYNHIVTEKSGISIPTEYKQSPIIVS